MLSLSKIAIFSHEYKSLSDRINSVLIEFNDIEKELEQVAESVVTNPQEAEATNQKLQFLYQLLKKHQVKIVLLVGKDGY